MVHKHFKTIPLAVSTLLMFWSIVNHQSIFELTENQRLLFLCVRVRILVITKDGTRSEKKIMYYIHCLVAVTPERKLRVAS